MGDALIQERVLHCEMTPGDLVGTIRHFVGHGSNFVAGQNFQSTAAGSFTKSTAVQEVIRGQHTGFFARRTRLWQLASPN